MAAESFQTVILGGGPGGYVAAIRAAQLGQKVAVVEKEKVGGVCLHRGCIPTKALLESAEVYHLAGRSVEFGVNVSNISYNYADILARKTKIVDQLHSGVEYLLQANKVTLVKGEGTVKSPKSLVVSGAESRELTTDNLVIATGSRPKSLPGLTVDGENVLFSDHALELDHVPKSVIIVGAGAVGVEFASLYNDFGAEVTVVELMPTIVPLEDRDVGQTLARVFLRRGIKVLTEARLDLETLKIGEGQVSVEVVTRGDKRERLSAEKVLVAVGREAVLDQAQSLKLETERGYVKVDGNMRSSVPGVYAIGDAIGGYLLAHVASAEGHQAVEAIAGEKLKPIDYNRVPRCTYCRPQIASMGMSEQEAKEKGHKVKSARYSFQSHGRALIYGDTDGFAKVVSDEATGELLGVHIIGPQATELIAEAALGRYLEATPLELGLSIHAHPTLSEALMEAALAVEGRPVHMVRR